MDRHYDFQMMILELLLNINYSRYLKNIGI